MADVEEKDPDDTLDQTPPNDQDQSEETESDSYWNFLEDDEFQYKLSNTELFQEWQNVTMEKAEVGAGLLNQ